MVVSPIKKRDSISVFELDGDDHLEGIAEEKQCRWRWKDELRDEWLLGLTDQTGHPVIRGVLRLPLWPPHRTDVPTLAGKIQSFVLNLSESKKQMFPVPSADKKLIEPALNEATTEIAEISVPKRGCVP